MDGTGQAKRSGKQAGRRTVPRMLATTKARARRLAPETAQEKRSKGQFIERMGEVGWNEFRPETDLGEDYAIQIHDGGASTGLSFYVQLKSIQDAQQRRPKGGAEELRYRLEVKDLERWEVQTTPVVLVVWDVRARRGYWQMIPKIVADLDRDNQGWREKKTVTVSVPMDQGTDDAGLRRLRWAVADHQRPLVPQTGTTEITFSFPPTPEGKAAAQAVHDLIDKGEATTVDGQFVASVRFPEWHDRLYGLLNRPLHVELKPKPSDRSIAVRIEVESLDGQFALPYDVELRPTRVGRNLLKLADDRPSSPLMVVLTIDKSGEPPRCDLEISRARHGNTVAAERDIIGFLIALTHRDARLRLIERETGTVFMRGPTSSANSTYPDIETLHRYHDLLGKLCFIQSRANAGEFTLKNDLSHEDAHAIDRVFTIMRHGRLEKTTTIEFTVNPSTDTGPRVSPKVGSAIPIDIDIGDMGSIDLLGVRLPLGPMRITVRDSARFLREYRRAFQQASNTGKTAHISMDALPVVEEYLDYLPASSSHDRLHEFAAGHAGYFTLRQALAAGYSSADILEAEERVERLAGDVFRLAQFPRSEHEDLLVLWLRSERKGVISHDTALSLHGLSDVLPSRVHLTLPPGYHPPDGSLGDGVDVHHAPIEDSDITWIGPIPVTKPLRTLRDCIEDHLSPDLIDQALDDAYQRGLIAEEDLEALQTARAKSA